MALTIDSVSFRTRWMRTRFPFRYGIASMTELPHVFAIAKVEIDGLRTRGLASEGLPPKWFTKNPETRFEDDLPAMLEVIRRAASTISGTTSESVFAAWRSLYEAQACWAAESGLPPLLVHLGTSLIERAVIDAFCRATGAAFPQAVLGNTLGIELGSIHEELAGTQPSDWLAAPRDCVIARHTVGLGDPLRPSEIAGDERVDDGLPHALSSVVREYGLTHFKIKLSGDLDTDIPRLTQIAEILREGSPGFKFTLDGNEQFQDVAAFRAHWNGCESRRELAELLNGEDLLFVEQPLHRDTALDERVGDDLAAWQHAPPMIIDESDGDLDSLRRALALGYRGTSHKNCKGVFKGIANRCLIGWQRRHRAHEGPWLMSGEDLANVGPVALLNDLAVMATLGIEDVERNGHHYFAGLSMFPRELQEQICARHPDLYSSRLEGFASLLLEEGRICTKTVCAAPFGHNLDLADQTFSLLGEEGLPD